jgi:hypothetical protein
MRKPRADQKEQLKSWQTELAESRQQLALPLARQGARR